ncbi:MAG: BMP family ABC transporter substrate-binding protein [Selenomonadaceae bacterium]|nr:BMP family ABC transporter substrate-binding protein [Selenomonadaceae bacterium]
MKKIVLLVFLIFVAAIAGILLSRYNLSNMNTDDTPTRVGLLLIGSRSDCSYNQAHYEALESLQDDLNLEIVCRENVKADCSKEIASLIEDEGCKIIVGVSFPFGESMEKAAREHPEIYFFHATGNGHSSNLSSFFGRMYQARYLSGIVAGMRTETGAIGYVAAFPIPEVIRGINAFALGVRSVRPDARIYVRYSDSWTADDSAGKAFLDLLDRHPIDVISLHTDSLQPCKEAEERGVWSVGYNMDNADLFPKTYLIACVWKWDVYYRQEIARCLQGKFHGSHVWMEWEDGIVALSGFTGNVREGTQSVVRTVNERFRSREFDVFYGPILDNMGNLRVEAGESMSDDEMQNSFDWYVEGVTVEQ